LASFGDDALPQLAVLRHAVEEVEVAAGRERLPFAGHDRDARVGVGVELREESREAEVQLVVDRVELLRARQAHDAHRAVGIDAGRSYSIVAPLARALRPSAGRGSESRRCSSGWPVALLGGLRNMHSSTATNLDAASAVAAAYSLGKEHGQAAGSWVVDGNT